MEDFSLLLLLLPTDGGEGVCRNCLFGFFEKKNWKWKELDGRSSLLLATGGGCVS